MAPYTLTPSLVLTSSGDMWYATGVFCYRPRSEASEGYVFTGICLSNSGGGGQHQRLTTSPSVQGQRSTTLPLCPGSEVNPPPPIQDQRSPTPSLGSEVNHLPLPTPCTPPKKERSLTYHHLPLPHRALCAGGRYASYWNAFLLCKM